MKGSDKMGLFDRKKGKGTFVEIAKRLTQTENERKAEKSKDKGNNESVANLKNIKKSKWL